MWVTEAAQHGDKILYAEVRKPPDWVLPAFNFKIGLLVYADNFEPLEEHTQTMVLVHELEHIQAHPQYRGEYVLKKHEVEDWSFMVRLLGPNWMTELNEHPEIDISRVKGFDKWEAALAGLTAQVEGTARATKPRKTRRRILKTKVHADKR